MKTEKNNSRKLNILVLGGKGQLGRSISKIVGSKTLKDEFHFVDLPELDITYEKDVECFFKNREYDFCINCAAYTAVDLAEDEKEAAYKVNAKALKHLVDICNQNNCTLLHISTDFVFDGKKNSAYLEIDVPNPLNVYGASKVAGEEYITKGAKDFFIIRTSWVFSEFGSNFLKKMLDLGKEKDVIRVVNDQLGSPTYAVDLAMALLMLIRRTPAMDYGIYHFCNSGTTSWFGFAKSIFEKSGLNTKVESISGNELGLKAKRPSYSVLDCSKIDRNLPISRRSWQEALSECLTYL
ncbi:MAG: dTDP-4-dehydrorhamnose reductase [Bacteroidota bacterium]